MLQRVVSITVLFALGTYDISYLLSKKNARLHKLRFSLTAAFKVSAAAIMMFIKTISALLYLASSMPPIACLLCTNCNDVVLLFNNTMELPSRCEGKLVEADVCQATFHTNYLTDEVHLNLTGANDLIGNYRLNLLVEDKFDDPERIHVNATYTCKAAADCAKLFYQLTIRTLIQNKPILDDMRSELYDSTKLNVQQCANDQDQPITCKNGYGCHGFEIILDGTVGFEGECRNASTSTILPRLYFRITLVQGDPPLASEWNHIGFTCNKESLCNTREQIRKMVKLANDFYPWGLIQVNSTTTTTTTTITTTMENAGFRDQEAMLYTIHGTLLLHCIVIIFQNFY